MTKFYSPYQFIKNDVVGKNKIEFEKITRGESHVRHDRWQTGTCSGRIICQLETVTPIFIGGERIAKKKDEAGVIKNYAALHNDKIKIAIPGNSLRGMIASVVEIISQSSMRILSDTEYSIRKSPRESLKAIGQVNRDENGSYTLTPLALISAGVDEKTGFINFENKWKNVFEGITLDQCLTAYVGDYSSENDPKVAGKVLSEWASFDVNQPNYVYARSNTNISKLTMSHNIDHNKYKSSLHISKIKHVQLLTGQNLFSNNVLKVSSEKNAVHTQVGILYIMGKHEMPMKKHEMPMKKHELFVPYDEQSIKNRKKLTLSDDVVNTFEIIANERREIMLKKLNKNKNNITLLPFLPQKHKRSKSDNANSTKFIQVGDIVYFDVNEHATEVTEISYSAIWRKKLKKSTFDYFRNDVSKHDILPWNSLNRTGLTPAEAMFGVVDNADKKSADTKFSMKNLASRILFYDAFSLQEEVKCLPEVTLKILDSPKPPSPVMYFHKKNITSVSKNNLNDKGIIPNGRKRYLNHHISVNQKPWESVDEKTPLKSKTKCTPIDVGNCFYFHIDFNNLSNEELGLLINSIEPNLEAKKLGFTKRFLHKIGMGKPLGLGSVDIKVAGVFCIDRGKRYTAEGVSAKRYSLCLMNENINWATLKNCYPKEYESKGNVEAIAGYFPFAYKNEYAFNTLYHLGCLESTKQDIPICYPYSSNQQPYNENKGFDWFTKSENLKQVLRYADDKIIPTLKV